MNTKLPADTITHHLLITGKVQGVFFRDSMRSEAQKLSVTGWVRNRRDGSVEAVVQGSPEAVAAIVNWAHHGPPAASVDTVTIQSIEGQYDGFFIAS